VNPRLRTNCTAANISDCATGLVGGVVGGVVAGGPLGVVVGVVAKVGAAEVSDRGAVDDAALAVVDAPLDRPCVLVAGFDADFVELPELHADMATTATQISAI